jgi:large subunit ribosomal protein L17
VKTTVTKAKVVRSLVERSITDGKTPTLASRRKLLKRFASEYPVNKIFDVLGPRYKDRRGGYTRIVKLGARKGDGSQMVQIELV